MNNLWNPDQYITACNFAVIAHADQIYKGPIEGQQFPYITHYMKQVSIWPSAYSRELTIIHST